MLNDELLKKILRKTGTFTSKGLTDLLAEKEASGKDPRLELFLLKEKKMPEEMLYRIVAQFYKLPFVNLRDQPIRQDILFLIPEPIAKSHGIVSFDQVEGELRVATLDPTNLQTFEFIKRKTNSKVKVYYTNPASLEVALSQYKKSLSAELGALTKAPEKEGGSEEERKKLAQMAEDIPIVRVVDSILEHAILEGSSDIHIEPSEREVTVRYRIDGILRAVSTFPRQVASGIVARIKILSNLKLDEHRLPQDGRFKIETPQYKYSFRVSIIPVYDGEKIVMRLLKESGEALTLDQLGFRPKLRTAVERNAEKPHGLLLVTGPTGSGKTTTLYAMLGMLNTPEVNLATIEDPIEYRMTGVNQSQVNTKIGFTFAAGLRSLLRQDPDVIMVGEIRDEETAGIAVQAAMTGHLVLGTLHTNSAAASIPRLVDMNVPPFLIAATTNVIVAQRLVRKICQSCIRSFKIPSHVLEQLREQLDVDKIWKNLKREGVVKADQTIEDTTFWAGSGCNECGDSGYKGRAGIHEVLDIAPPIAELIAKKATTAEIQNKAIEDGMLLMIEDGFIKAIKGVTTIEEILRVTKE
jgi:type IV pilus assembly protein PilB